MVANTKITAFLIAVIDCCVQLFFLNLSMAKQFFTYETKCRRCSEIIEHALPAYPDFSDFKNWQRVHHYVTASLPDPKISDCDNCKKTTIQDFVSIESKPPE
ncbi:MAG: hypothetical protein CMO82_11220 [Winogradskyella sp.]|nr:hypothetical protein [Winogradskyella sp.]|tara:strand:+ start:26764 stop:27069 length:306 start_codon:yes stop_codon:yes gene_type:complete